MIWKLTKTLPLLFSSAVFAGPIDTVIKNKNALSDIEKGHFADANKTLSDAVVDNPKEAVLFYNLGVTYEENEEKDKAIQSYLASARLAKDPDLQFSAYFNAARILGDMKQIEPAIAVYQKALEIHPESVEAKTNIELLFQGGGGGGKGKNKDDKDKKEGEGENKDQSDQQNDQPKPSDQKKNEKPKPRPFDSKELSPQDAKKILDELKRQEEQVRAKFNEKRHRDTPVEKDW
jgi:Ca-activated chloride channel family protein